MSKSYEYGIASVNRSGHIVWGYSFLSAIRELVRRVAECGVSVELYMRTCESKEHTCIMFDSGATVQSVCAAIVSKALPYAIMQGQVSRQVVFIVAREYVNPLDVVFALLSPQFHAWLEREDGLFDALEVEKLEIGVVEYRGVRAWNRVREIDLYLHYAQSSVPWKLTIRDDSVAAIVRLWCGTDVRVVAVKQPRIPILEVENVELPAGMLDAEDPLRVIVREVKEEAGLTLTKEQFVRITPPQGVSLAPASTSERMHAFVCDLQVSATELARIEGQRHGLMEEGECTVVSLLPESNLIASAGKVSGTCLAVAWLMEHEQNEWRYATRFGGDSCDRHAQPHANAFVLARRDALVDAMSYCTRDSGQNEPVWAQVWYRDQDGSHRMIAEFFSGRM